MIEFPQILEEAFRQYGLWGLFIAFLVLGPGFTYVRTENTRMQLESKAQELLYHMAREEHNQANRMETRLNEALDQLAEAREEIAQLKLDLQQAKHDLDHVSQLNDRVRTLDTHVDALEEQLDGDPP